MRACLCLAALGTVLVVPVVDAAPAYVGKWAADPAQCKLDQSSERAPLVVKASGYDQQEAHCTFAKVVRTADNTWRIRGSCSVEGDKQPLSMTLSVKGDTLTMRDTAIRMLQRCK